MADFDVPPKIAAPAPDTTRAGQPTPARPPGSNWVSLALKPTDPKAAAAAAKKAAEEAKKAAAEEKAKAERAEMLQHIRTRGITLAFWGHNIKREPLFIEQAKAFAQDHGAIGLAGDKLVCGKAAAMKLDRKLEVQVDDVIKAVKKLEEQVARDTPAPPASPAAPTAVPAPAPAPWRVDTLALFTHGEENQIQSTPNSGNNLNWTSEPLKESAIKHLSSKVRVVFYACRTTGQTDEDAARTTPVPEANQLAQKVAQQIHNQFRAERPGEALDVTVSGHDVTGHTTANPRLTTLEAKGAAETKPKRINMLSEVALAAVKWVEAKVAEDAAEQFDVKELTAAMASDKYQQLVKNWKTNPVQHFSSCFDAIPNEREAAYQKAKKDGPYDPDLKGRYSWDDVSSPYNMFLREVPIYGLQNMVPMLLQATPAQLAAPWLEPSALKLFQTGYEKMRAAYHEKMAAMATELLGVIKDEIAAAKKRAATPTPPSPSKTR